MPRGWPNPMLVSLCFEGKGDLWKFFRPHLGCANWGVTKIAFSGPGSPLPNKSTQECSYWSEVLFSVSRSFKEACQKPNTVTLPCGRIGLPSMEDIVLSVGCLPCQGNSSDLSSKQQCARMRKSPSYSAALLAHHAREEYACFPCPHCAPCVSEYITVVSKHSVSVP